MDYNVLKYKAIIATVDLGSFTKASQLIGCSQSGISRMVSDLEKEFGFKLLDRNRNGVFLTPMGNAMMPYFRNLSESFDRMQEKALEAAAEDDAPKKLSIASTAMPATHRLPKLMQRFLENYPDTTYEIHVGNNDQVMQWLESGDADCGFAEMRPKMGFEQISIERVDLVAVMAKDHPLAWRQKFPVRAFSDYTFISLKDDSQDIIGKIFAENRVKPHQLCTVTDESTVISMVKGGLGVSILPSMALEDKDGEIISKNLSVPAHMDFAMFIPKASATNQDVENLRKCVEARSK